VTETVAAEPPPPRPAPVRWLHRGRRPRPPSPSLSPSSSPGSSGTRRGCPGWTRGSCTCSAPTMASGSSGSPRRWPPGCGPSPLAGSWPRPSSPGRPCGGGTRSPWRSWRRPPPSRSTSCWSRWWRAGRRRQPSSTTPRAMWRSRPRWPSAWCWSSGPPWPGRGSRRWSGCARRCSCRWWPGRAWPRRRTCSPTWSVACRRGWRW